MLTHSQRYIRISSSLLFILLLTLTNNAHSVEIVRLQIFYDGTPHPMDIELFDDVAPATVANYLDYVTSTADSTDPDGMAIPKYDDTFIYRNVSGLLLQGGGYTFRTNQPAIDYLITPAFDPVGSFVLDTVKEGQFSPVLNEFSLSNIRGTIAMAKIAAQFVEGGDCTEEIPEVCTLVAGTGPDTASREWFINLSDNTNLDSINGGFTVFGKIIDDGLVIADEISAFPDRPFAGIVLGPSFDNLPVVNYDTDTLPDVLQEHLVMITTIESGISRPILRFSPNNVDFLLDVAGDGINPTISAKVENTGNEMLVIGNINTGDISSPLFSITSTDCSGKTLAPVSTPSTDSCTIDYTFSPTLADIGEYIDNITITYTDLPVTTPYPYSVTVNLTGEGVDQTPVLKAPTGTVQFFDTIVNETSDTITITVSNNGGGSLELLSPILINGVNNSDFSITTTSCTIDNAMLIGETCDITIQFSPLIAGIKTAELFIQSTGGDATIPINATAIIPVISVEPTFTIIAQIGEDRKKFLNITNSGTSTLVINDAFFSGPDAALFTQENDCPDTNNIDQLSSSLEPGSTCRFLIIFAPTDFGEKTATLTIESNDPLNPSVDISLFGTADFDIDGVPGDIEILAPNNGDANNDDIADKTQNDVASLLSLNDNYITFITESSLNLQEKTSLSNVLLLDSIPADIPEDAAFDYGLYSYSILLPVGDGVNMAILLPTNVNPDKFYKFGPTPADNTPHWYDFSYDKTTGLGAKFLGTVTIQSPSGVGVQKNFVIITYLDGQKGDDDLEANGIILNSKSGLSFSNAAPDTGSLLWTLFLIPFSILIYRRYN